MILFGLLVDRERIGHERLIFGTVREDNWLVLAEPFGRGVDGGLASSIRTR